MTTPPPGADRPRWLWPNSTIVKVVDADTIDARVTRDMGFGGRIEFIVRLRLNRINAPAANTSAGKQATAFVIDFTYGQPVLIETLKPYKYGGPDTSPGEWMAEVTLPDGTNLSDLLATRGHAVYWNGTGPRPADGDNT